MIELGLNQLSEMVPMSPTIKPLTNI